eukprot:260785-Rhodomonas_salina.5
MGFSDADMMGRGGKTGSGRMSSESQVLQPQPLCALPSSTAPSLPPQIAPSKRFLAVSFCAASCCGWVKGLAAHMFCGGADLFGTGAAGVVTA